MPKLSPEDLALLRKAGMGYVGIGGIAAGLLMTRNPAMGAGLGIGLLGLPIAALVGLPMMAKYGGNLATNIFRKAAGQKLVNGVAQHIPGTGLGAFATRMAGGALREATDIGAAAEMSGRAFLTGNLNPFSYRPGNLKRFTASNPITAWLPEFHTGTGLAKFTLNTKIAPRLVGLGVAAAAISGIKEAAFPHAPPPTLYFDGVNMKSKNDMGADGNLATAFMGKASSLNADEKRRIITSLFT